MKKLFKKFAAIGMAAMMIMAMGVTTFAAEETLAAGNYSVDTALYKDEACTEISMGDDALVSTAVTVNNDGTATIYFTTKDIEVTRLGITVTGHLKSMMIYDANGTAYSATTEGKNDNDQYVFTVQGFPADQLNEGAVFSASFEANVIIIPVNMSGYMKFTNFVAQ